MKFAFIIFLSIFSFANTYADCALPNHCSRSCWDPNGTHPAQTSPSYTNVTHIIVHHTGDGVVFPANTDYAAKVRYYWDLHVNTNGWSDIGYNWLIDRNGVIYEGRGSGVSGAHFSGHNAGTMGVSMIGDFTLESPSASALNSLKNLIAWEATDKNVDVTGVSYHASSGLNLNNISGHKDGGATSCPGTDLYSLLPSIRTDISNMSCYTNTTPTGLDCSSAIELSNGVVYSGSSSTASSNISSFGCNSWTETGPERVHKITPTADGTITVNLSNYSGDLDVYILGSCDPTDCLGTVSSDSAIFTNAVAGQTYYLVVDADDGSGSSYDIVATYPVAVVSEDITLSNTSVNLTTVTAGNDIDVSATQNYSGSQLDADLPSFDLGYYLSTDCNLSANDILLGSDTSSLGSDDTSNNESETLTIPSNTAAGTYYIIFSADDDKELTESDETNNTSCIEITINAYIPEDITVSNTSVNLVTVTAGNNIEVSAMQNYSGSQLDADLPSFDLGYYLSTDCVLSANDVLLGSDASSLGSDDVSSNESETLTIPSNTTAGTYYIIFSADDDKELTESDETNNTSCIEITIEAVLSVKYLEFQKQLTVYPNPTSNFINIKSKQDLTIDKFYVYDINGRLIKEVNGNSLDKINISELTNGIYLLKIVSNENKKAVFRIVKK
ncbi:N-acetylmuramoyl-L-alanine amidase [Polaribacter sp. MSW13]|uniref:N-acetylmuramoyl-L-alanine amidase n=1 Tax=Polaribacter marinus TaxID=2916838 RepID=A0A9X1VL45_9FLAO|nr:T9SS type A sorting domain-containing protein [Polaribacter marinus]MCI2228156.1 N-acetylmuramoyl-L-alanine amidase [Polaribacter marinus]